MESKVLIRYCVECGHLLMLRVRYPIFFDALDAVLFEDDMYVYSKCPFCGGTTSTVPNPRKPIKMGSKTDKETGKRIEPIIDTSCFPRQYRLSTSQPTSRSSTDSSTDGEDF